MNNHSYIKNAIVVLDDRSTWGGIEEADIVIFKEMGFEEMLYGLDDARCLDWDNPEFDAIDDDGTLPSDLIYERVSIKTLLKFYQKHKDNV